ncbi:MAG: hypothetical protein IJH71_10940 [Eubacterium sp.]|nr:hypothetical protein [Eubacterium sp.]
METGKILHVKMYGPNILMERIFIPSCKNQFYIVIDGKLLLEHEDCLIRIHGKFLLKHEEETDHSSS